MLVALVAWGIMHDNTQKPPIIFLEKKKKSFLLYTQNVDGPENVALWKLIPVSKLCAYTFIVLLNDFSTMKWALPGRRCL